MNLQSRVKFAYNNFSYKDSSLITTQFHRSWQNSYLLRAFEFGYNDVASGL